MPEETYFTRLKGKLIANKYIYINTYIKQPLYENPCCEVSLDTMYSEKPIVKEKTRNERLADAY